MTKIALSGAEGNIGRVLRVRLPTLGYEVRSASLAPLQPQREGEALVHATEKQLQENGDKIPAGDKQAIEAAIAELKTALEGNNTAEIASKTQALVQASMKIGEALYGGGPQGAAPGGESQPGQEGVVDAEFEEVDGKNKKSA